MIRRLIPPLLFGALGIAALISLGVWQLHRLSWKQAILAEIDTRIAAPVVALPANPDPQADRYLPVTATGTLSPGPMVLTSTRRRGPGHRVIAVLDTGARRVLVDLGFLPQEVTAGALPGGPVRITGNLHWPDETDSYTPEPELAHNLWFARDVPAMAAALQTEPLMIVARRVSPPIAGIIPLPVTSVGVANNHLQYAITWFSLAFVWLGMTGLFVWRIRRQTD